MKALGSRFTAGTWCVLPVVLAGACATRELPASHAPNSALTPKAKAGAVQPVTAALDAEPGAGAPDVPSAHAHHQHGGHQHGQ